MNMRQLRFRMVVSSLAALVGLPVAQAQVTISRSDMFNVVGQYYRAYSNGTNSVDVTGLAGPASATEQAWNFVSGPATTTNRFDYLAPNTDTLSTNFVAATFVERKIDEADTNTTSWLYLSWASGAGRQVYGFVDSVFNAAQPVSVFTPALRDFPDTITYGQTWTGTTGFDSNLDLGPDPTDPEAGDIVMPAHIDYSFDSKVDAFGKVVLPGLGFGDCLRINELETYNFSVDLGGGDIFQYSQFVRNFYWIQPGRGIVVQINSKQSDSAPLDNFTSAVAIVRMFETNHPGAEPPPPPTIQGFSIALDKSGALLTWTKLTGITSYRVESTTNPGNPAGWQALGSPTSGNFLFDATANSPGNPVRFYRVVGLQ